MSAEQDFYADVVETNYTDARYKLGSLRTTDGPEVMPSGLSTDRRRTWVFVLNGEASTNFVQGTLVSYKTATVSPGTGVICPTSGGTGILLGVAQHTIPYGSYGWILKTGEGEVLADTGGITADLGLVPGNAVAGRADDRAAVTDFTFARAFEAAAATALATCYISCP